MTALDIGAPAPRYRMPYPAPLTAPLTGPLTAPAPPPSMPTAPPVMSPVGWDWDGRVDTLPLLRTTDIRSMERLRAIRDYAHRGMADIDFLLDLLDAAGGPSVEGAGSL
ncbi:hypothetical protein [Nonomuraea turcica]|uniref:hypothetical protein n=1 Tax=Nonomuraea sp. G32 TaxID=3067274 RepID=UPI00273ADC73|nr:hypothetical protein [Nonomuraea sp. G32]MDP4511830.1 hypothetical protein [Nonomuraea sp. G32]